MPVARILVGVTGGIAAYKACELVRLLVRAGHDVTPIVTRGAEEFVAAETFWALARKEPPADPYPHLAGADLLVVAPLTANTLARLAHGLADDLLTETALAHRGALLLAPAMNTAMWEHPATQANLALLVERGAVVVGPDDGELAEGLVGAGRMAEPEEIARAPSRSSSADGDGRNGRSRAAACSSRPAAPGSRSTRCGSSATARPAGWASRSPRPRAKRGADVTLLAANLHVAPPAGVEVVADADRRRPAPRGARPRRRGRRPDGRRGRRLPAGGARSRASARRTPSRGRLASCRPPTSRGHSAPRGATARCSSRSAPSSGEDGPRAQARDADREERRPRRLQRRGPRRHRLRQPRQRGRPRLARRRAPRRRRRRSRRSRTRSSTRSSGSSGSGIVTEPRRPRRHGARPAAPPRSPSVSSRTSARRSTRSPETLRLPLLCLLAEGHVLVEDVPGRRQDGAREGARAVARADVPPRPVHARPPPGRRDGRQRLRPAERRVPLPGRPGVRQRPARRRDQPGVAEDAVGAARGDAGDAGDGRRHDARPRAAVPRDRDPEPRRVRGDVPAARGAARPLRRADDDRLSAARRRGADARRADDVAAARPPAAGRRATPSSSRRSTPRVASTSRRASRATSSRSSATRGRARGSRSAAARARGSRCCRSRRRARSSSGATSSSPRTSRRSP